MVETTRSSASEQPQDHSTAPGWLDRAEHSFVLWAFVEAAMLLGLLFATLMATQTAPGAFFWVTWVLALVMAVFVLPAWALAYLGGPNEEASDLAEDHQTPAPMAVR